MKIVPMNKVRLGMKLAQNIYRNDSLLAFPKGVTITGFELDALKGYSLEYVLVNDSNYNEISDDDINYTLDIIESVYTQNVLWEEEFGRELFDHLEKKIISNKKLIKYLNELRCLDSYSFAHCINISILVAIMLNVDDSIDEELIHLVLLSLVHDVGRIKMKKIFNKTGKLDSEEFEMLKEHPFISFKLLKKAGFSEYDLKFVQETHEKYDGSGYPNKLRGFEISNLAQIILIADIYNALSSYRPYRKAYLTNEVLEIIKSEEDKGFAKHYIELFLEKFNPYSIGDQVELTDGKMGIIRIINSRTKTSPIIDIIDDNGNFIKTVDLSLHKEMSIKKVIKAY